MSGRGQHILPGDGPLLPEMPMPPMPPPELEAPPTKDYTPEQLRVIALAAAVDSTSTHDLAASVVHRKVLIVADEYLKWLKKDRAS